MIADDVELRTNISESSASSHTTRELWKIPVGSIAGKDVLTNFFKAVKEIKSRIEEWERMGDSEMYNLQPVLIAEGVNSSILEELPSVVGEYHVKCIVRDHKLYIANLSNETSHGIGVSFLNGQAGAWNTSLLFTTSTDTTFHSNNGANGSSPDLSISIAPQHRAPGDTTGRLVIIELDVSNRDIEEMRQQYLPYFESPSIYAVVGIKLLTTNRQRLYPTQRALAVQWTRGPDAIHTERVCDFGLFPISHAARARFARNVANSLPAVPPCMWTDNRYVPVPRAALPEHNEGSDLAAADVYIKNLRARTALQNLYGGASPTFVLSGATLQGFLHNLPPDEPPIGDFVLDLGSLMYRIQLVAPHQV